MWNLLRRWLPSIIVMIVIFAFSSRPANELPNFSWADHLVKKGGHAIGYALLAFTYLRALVGHKSRSWLAWALAILYAITDEFHQTIVPGRHPSMWDVIIFDNLGAAVGLMLAYWYSHRTKQAKTQS